MGFEKIIVGGIAICAQTGMINPQAFPYADLHFGVSKICDYGNKCDVDESTICLHVWRTLDSQFFLLPKQP